MEAKYTPDTFGVWEIREVRRVPDYGDEFLEIGNEINSCAYVPRLHPDADKIAALLKAAPDLLAALEEAEYALNAATEQYAADKGRRSTILDGRLEIVRQAIAKAKGDPC